NQFDLTSDVNGSATNSAARVQDIYIFLCPSDPNTVVISNPTAVGRTNYYPNFGLSADWTNKSQTTGGPFYRGSAVKFTDITDGASNTAMFAEIKQGNNANNSTWDVLAVNYTVWDANAANDLTPLPDCNN